MSAHVVVIDSAARRHNIKTTPSKYMSDVLAEACTKLGLNSSQYSLKHNNKTVDLSRTVRLSGLPSGAKLELVQLSRSAGVVSVALQLPESEAQGAQNSRLTDKFPSSTTLWLLLRKFESGVAGNAPAGRNLTAKGAPSINSGNSGAGRLYYQQPVLQVMSRELASFADLQKSLSQLGFNTGSALLRLNYRPTELPLEEALAQIQQYFDSIDSETPLATPAQRPTPSDQLAEFANRTNTPSSTITQSAPAATSVVNPAEAASGVEIDPATASVGDRPVSVYRPPTASTPSAVSASYNEADYTPTIEHAQIHQKMLQQSTQNKRLPTDAELEQQAREEQEKWSAIKDVEIKIRFPDQSSVSAKFNRNDTAAELYDFARGCLNESFRNEPFALRNPGVRGKGDTIPDDVKKLLIKDLQLKGRIMVVFGWNDQASMQARGSRHVLKPSLRNQAQDLQAPQIANPQDERSDPGIKVNIGNTEPSGGGGEGSGGKKIPKWLKGLAKK